MLLSRDVAGVEGVAVVSVGAGDALLVRRCKAFIGRDADVRAIGVGGIVAAQLVVGNPVGVDENEAVFRNCLCQRVHGDVLLQIDLEISGGALCCRGAVRDAELGIEIPGLRVWEDHRYVPVFGCYEIGIGSRYGNRILSGRKSCSLLRQFHARAAEVIDAVRGRQAEPGPKGGRIAVCSAVRGLPKEEIPVPVQTVGHIVRRSAYRPDHFIHGVFIGSGPRTDGLDVDVRRGVSFDCLNRGPGTLPHRAGPGRRTGRCQADPEQDRKSQRNQTLHCRCPHFC